MTIAYRNIIYGESKFVVLTLLVCVIKPLQRNFESLLEAKNVQKQTDTPTELTPAAGGSEENVSI